MVVTALDFVHMFTSSSKLARKVKRRVKKVIQQVTLGEKEEEALKQAEDSGDVNAIKDEWHKLSNIRIKEENYFSFITEKELILEKEEEDEIRVEDKELVTAAHWVAKVERDSAGSKLDKVIKKLRRELQKVADDVRTATDKERVEARDLFLDRHRWGMYVQTYPKLLCVHEMRVYARKERRYIRADKAEERQVDELVKSIHLLKDEKDANKRKATEDEIADKLEGLMDQLIAHFEGELKAIYRILHYINIFHMHMLIEVLEDDTKELQKLLEEKFPKQAHDEMADELQSVVNRIESGLRKYYQEARYVRTHA